MTESRFHRRIIRDKKICVKTYYIRPVIKNLPICPRHPASFLIILYAFPPFHSTEKLLTNYNSISDV